MIPELRDVSTDRAAAVSASGRALVTQRICHEPEPSTAICQVDTRKNESTLGRRRASPEQEWRGGPEHMLRMFFLAGLVLLDMMPAGAQTAVPATARRQNLVHMVRQDCGSCHGMRLTGGLGPALTPEALREKPAESLAATIYHGRPGTPMPSWKAMLSDTEALWIARQLQRGFPQE